MAINNNTTLEYQINGAGVDLTAEVLLTLEQNNARFSNGGHVARFKKQIGSGNYLTVGPEIQLTATSEVDIVSTVTYRDTALSDNTTYKYFLEMDVQIESGAVLQ